MARRIHKERLISDEEALEQKSKEEHEILTKEGKEPKLSELKRKTLQRRKERIPLNEQRRLASLPKDDGYHYRWVNDQGDKIYQFFRGGYEVVDRDYQEIQIDRRFQDTSWKHSALSQPVGDGIIAYCMRIPQELWEEDQIKKQSAILDSENRMKRVRIQGQPDDKVYGEIRIDR